MIREPVVAGRFYPANARELRREVEQYLAPRSGDAQERQRAMACVVPHAGIMYSGHVAGAVYARLEIPRRLIVLCPRHFPPGQPLAILREGAWRTPLGDAPLDEALAEELMRECSLLREDAVAHSQEHSIEVQLPFLQARGGEFRFVPIALGTDRYAAFEELGRAIARVVAAASARGEQVLVVASSDLNHYESDEVTRRKDARAIEQMLALDARGLYDTVRNEGITMCGFGPVTAMLVAAHELGATRAELIGYATSADAGGDRNRVVGYAGIAIH